MKAEIYTAFGQRYYSMPRVNGSVPVPEHGSTVVHEDRHVCIFHGDGTRWVTLADGSKQGVVIYHPDGTWQAFDGQRVLCPDYIPTGKTKEAVLSTFPKDPLEDDEKPAAPQTYHGSNLKRAVDELADRMQEGMLKSIPAKGSEGLTAGDLEEVRSGTFEIVLDLEVVPPSCPNLKFPVSARPLHAYMQIGKDFSSWMKDRIGKFQFVKDVDFIVCSPNLGSKECGVESSGRGGHNAKDYWLTASAARMLAADVNSELGVKVIKFLNARHERLEVLERGATLVLPQTYAEALRALADSAEEAQKLKIENLQAQQVIGETKALLSDTKVELETAKDQLEILAHKIELPKVSILTEDFCKLYGNVLGVTELKLFQFLYRHKILYWTKRGPVPYETAHNHEHFDVSEEAFFNTKTGVPDTRKTTKWTPEGVKWLRDYLLQHPDMLLSQLLVAPGTKKAYQRLKGLRLVNRATCEELLPAPGWIDYIEFSPEYFHCSTIRDGNVYQAFGKSLKEVLAKLASKLPAKSRKRK